MTPDLHNRLVHIYEATKDAPWNTRKLLKARLDTTDVSEPAEEPKEPCTSAHNRGKGSTTGLRQGSGEIDHIHDVITRELREKRGIEWHDFPNDAVRQEVLNACVE